MINTPKIILVLLQIISVFSAYGTINTYKNGEWQISVNGSTGSFSISNNNKFLLKENSGEFCVGLDTISFSDCSPYDISISDEENKLGKSIKYDIKGKYKEISVTQSISIYPDDNFCTLQMSLKSPDIIKSGYIAPVNILENFQVFDNLENYVISIPYDNDAWVRYKNIPLGENIPESYEIAILLNSKSREGLVFGSLEHDTWKSGIKIASQDPKGIDSIKVFAGVTSELTRDKIPHGKVKGENIKSPLFFIGRYDDWRNGIEEFADLCNLITPQLNNADNRPYGWNSWGKLQTNINPQNASEVSDFFRCNLQSKSFENEGIVYIGLDSFWDKDFTPESHKEFTNQCKSNGQKAGIYFCPFTDWYKNPERTVEELPEYKYKDLYLYGDGKIIEFDGAYALDPTHPATKARIKKQVEEFNDWGYEFVKLDFMAHGAYEADSHYNSDITTGTQAYNEGMKFINEIIDGKLWINLSIAPLFPANYANSRRIGCDAWADINNTEYTLNALTYGWWLDHLYNYNDADHIVLEGVTEGENRARITSSAITGLYFLGDDLSESGDSITKERVKNFLTNPGINKIARECKSFRPVEIGQGDKATDTFYYLLSDTMYLAVFNFDEIEKQKTIDFSRLGLDSDKKFQAKELWAGENLEFVNDLIIDIPPKDVKVFKISI